MPTDWERARAETSAAYFDELSWSLDPIVGNFNSNFVDDMDRIHRIDPRPILGPGELPGDGRARLFQRKTCFLKVIREGPLSLLIGWGYWVPGTGDVVFPELNRLMLAPDGWRLYRYYPDIGRRDHLAGADTLPYHLAKTLVERLAEVSSGAPELATSLAL